MPHATNRVAGESSSISFRPSNAEKKQLIHRGRYTEVWRSEHPLTGEPIAIKCTAHTGPPDEDARQRLLNEARTTRRLEHENIMRIFEIGMEDSGHVFFTMPLLDGSLAEFSNAGRELRQSEFADVVIDISRALVATHRSGVVHGDVRPENIVYHSRGSGRRWVLTDFGIAASANGFGSGTAPFTAPELYSEGSAPSVATDTYAFAMTLLAILRQTQLTSEAMLTIRSQLNRFLRNSDRLRPVSITALALAVIDATC